MNTQCPANSDAVLVHPPSLHMHLGRGISAKKMSAGSTCIEHNICVTSDDGYASLSESDLFAMFSDSGCTNQELDQNVLEESTRQENLCTKQVS
jgi:hypothetical protein